ncbi:hypothetical protein [Actinacidiphila acidipaludis]|uniref:Uncharacterized protein n=1 Tax=Actinacidiphila acidipaludis TaxID=2873382 RepID=A0ABS7QLA0_9ACTN|nr:hypothetical protein [Streptomyces acidipaludis]MBY8882569.1 hypothetical protein [Streptomyces acidipaludis]
MSAFLDGTSGLPHDADLETGLILTGGDRTWEPDDLAAVDSATSADPGRLRLRTAVNRLHDCPRDR